MPTADDVRRLEQLCRDANHQALYAILAPGNCLVARYGITVTQPNDLYSTLVLSLPGPTPPLLIVKSYEILSYQEANLNNDFVVKFMYNKIYHHYMSIANWTYTLLKKEIEVWHEGEKLDIQKYLFDVPFS